MISTVLNGYLPPGWTVTHLILLDPEWQINAKDDEHVATATGDTIEGALERLSLRISDHEYRGVLSSVFTLRDRSEAKPFIGSLVDHLGLRPKTDPINRRF